jgi:hypothetical protein
MLTLAKLGVSIQRQGSKASPHSRDTLKNIHFPGLYSSVILPYILLAVEFVIENPAKLDLFSMTNAACRRHCDLEFQSGEISEISLTVNMREEYLDTEHIKIPS